MEGHPYARLQSIIPSMHFITPYRVFALQFRRTFAQGNIHENIYKVWCELPIVTRRKYRSFARRLKGKWHKNPNYIVPSLPIPVQDYAIGRGYVTLNVTPERSNPEKEISEDMEVEWIEFNGR